MYLWKIKFQENLILIFIKISEMNFSNREKLLPKEEMLEITRPGNRFSIGLPRETSYHENRISLIPDAVKTLVNNGHELIIERNAGVSAHISDTDYAEVGAVLVDTPDEVFKADIILKVAPLSFQEIQLLKRNSVVISALHLAVQSKEFFKQLSEKKATAIAFEYIKDKSNAAPVVKSISEIAGTASIQIASEYLSSEKFGNGRMLGGFTGISPSEVVILGAGTVGEYACRLALGMGALVKVFDNSIYKLHNLKTTIHQNLFTSTIQETELKRALKTADVVISAVYSRNGRSPVIITEQMVESMKQGAVIVDVSIDQGGCVETSRITTHQNPVFQFAGVTHYCVPNIASRFPQTASTALSNFFAPMLIRAGENGGIEGLLSNDFYLRQGVYLYHGILTNKNIGEHYGMSYQDVDLLIAAFR
jgi:alanine dehydrogenase